MTLDTLNPWAYVNRFCFARALRPGLSRVSPGFPGVATAAAEGRTATRAPPLGPDAGPGGEPDG